MAGAAEIRIRPAGDGDVAAIERLVERAYSPYVPRIGFRPGPMRVDYPARVAAGGASVVEEGGEVVGLIVLALEPEHLLVENVAVAPERQGEGIGGALLDFAEDAAREAGLETIRLFTHEKMSENQGIYLRLGYEETHREAMDDFELVHFARRLRD